MRMSRRRPFGPLGEDKELFKTIETDYKDEFIAVLERQQDKYRDRAQAILDLVVTIPKIRCAEALITGETALTVDLNLPCCPYGSGMVALHKVASVCPYLELIICPSCRFPSPAMIELLVCSGARTDIPLQRLLDDHQVEPLLLRKTKRHVNRLPLQMALHGILPRYYKDGWTPEDSIYKLITILCLPRLQNHLEAIALLAGTTKETGELFLKYVMDGSTVEVACLLVAAPKEKLHDVMDQVQLHFDSMGNNAKLASTQELLKVFDRAGDQISAYVKENKLNVSQCDTIIDVKRLLRASGFHFMDSEVDLSDDPRYKYVDCNNSDCYEVLRCLDDFGMAHYSKSGYRWEVSSMDPWLGFLNHEAYVNELKNEVKRWKTKVLQAEKKRQQLNLQIWMDKELWSALQEDDKEEFLSILDRKDGLFVSREQQILYAVCCSGAIKCAEALVKGETRLTVDLNAPCTDAGLYPLHCAALSLFPSITELFLYHGARTGTRVTPRNPSDIFPQHLLQLHTNKLPLHMALQGISCLPCIREWTINHSIHKLVALLCLPRMQQPLETLGLLAMTTKETEKEFLQLAMDGKLVELAALLLVAPKKLYDVMFDAYYQCWCTDPLDEGDRQIKKAGFDLHTLFDLIHDDIAAYVKEDKSNVSKYQVVGDLKSIIDSNGFLDMDLDMDLSVYNWYHNEEGLYPLEAPYECVHRSPSDVGMEHYSKTSYRWRGSKRGITWNPGKIKDEKLELLTKLGRLQTEHEEVTEWLQKEMKPATFGNPFILRQGVLIASSNFFSLNANAKKRVHGTSQVLQNNLSTKAMSSVAALSNLQYSHSRNSMLGMISSSNLPALLSKTMISMASLMKSSRKCRL